MTECMNCCNPIRTTQSTESTVKCGSCNKSIHAECLNLPQDVMFTVIRLKSDFIKIQCRKCNSNKAKVEELRNIIIKMKEDLTTGVRALEEAMGKIDSEKIQVEIKTEPTDFFDGETAIAGDYSESNQENDQECLTGRKNNSDSIYSTAVNNEYLTQDVTEICNKNFIDFINKTEDCVKTKQIDLFSMPVEYSLVHCVAEDMKMDSGIAMQFRREFGRVDELLNQRQQSGGLAVLKDHERFIYYLVTKKHSSEKATYATLFSSLLALAKHVVENNVKRLAMPILEPGLDHLKWDRVRLMIEYVFREHRLEIVICDFLQAEESRLFRQHKRLGDSFTADKADSSFNPPPQKRYRQDVFLRAADGESSSTFRFGNNQTSVNEEPSTSQVLRDSEADKNTNWWQASGIYYKFKTLQGSLFEDQMELSDSNQENEERCALNAEYQKYLSDYKFNKICIKKLKYRHVSNLPKRYSDVCYVSEDFYFPSPMTSKFDISLSIGRLLNYHHKEGSCGVLKGFRDHTFCLIVKKLSTSTCQRDVVFRSLQLLRQQALFFEVKKLVFPVMENMKGDLFDWSEVSYMIEFLFEKMPFELLSVFYNKVKTSEKYLEYIKETNKIKIKHVKHPLFQMKRKSFIIYWVSEDGYITQVMRSLDIKFNFLKHFQKSAKKIGEIIRYKPDEDYVLYGCVIRRTPESAIDFAALQKCVVSVNFSNIESFRLAAVPAVEDRDEATNYKIVNVLMNCLKHVVIHFSWTGDLKQKMPPKPFQTITIICNTNK